MDLVIGNAATAEATQYATQEELELDPLPCWRHLSPEQYRAQIATLVETIAPEARACRQGSGIKPLGPAPILAQDPLARPRKSKRSSAPRVHAASKLVRKAMYEAYAWFVACFREAAAKLRAGVSPGEIPRRELPAGAPLRRLGHSRIAHSGFTSSSPPFDLRIPSST